MAKLKGKAVVKNRLFELAKEIKDQKPKPKRGKSNHTFYLDTDHFLALRAICQERGIKPSEMIERLIVEFLNTAKDAEYSDL